MYIVCVSVLLDRFQDGLIDGFEGGVSLPGIPRRILRYFYNFVTLSRRGLGADRCCVVCGGVAQMIIQFKEMGNVGCGYYDGTRL